MKTIKRLPDAEFEIMKVIWQMAPPVTSKQIMENLQSNKNRKPQTVLTMLIRLIEKGFLESEKIGKERSYTPIVTEQDYLEIETGDFIKRYYGNSLGTLVKTLYAGQNLTQEDLQDLKEWLSERS